MKEKQALKLLNELWADLQQPDLIWQLVALFACVGLAWFFARWWRRRDVGQQGYLHAASTRLAFPLLAALLLAVTHEVMESLQHAGLLDIALSLFAALALVRICVYMLRQSFRQALWLAAFERWVAAVIWIGLALYITGLSPFVITALERLSLTVGDRQVNLWTLATGSLTVLATLVIALWLAGLIEARLLRAEKLDSSLRIVSVRVSKALLTLVALMSALSMVGIDITALSVFTGALGVGLGFGLQKIASNYVSGFIILLDRSIRIGNVVQVGNDSGMVTEITTRYTVLRNLSGVEFIVPNETLVSGTVQNQSYSDSRVCVLVLLGVAYDTDLDAAMQLMESAAQSHPRVLADPPPKAALVKFAESAIDLELAFWVDDPELGLKGVRSDVALALWRAFRAAKIVIPLPQREVRVIELKETEQKKPPPGEARE